MKRQSDEHYEHLIEEVADGAEIRASRKHGDSRWNIVAPGKPPVKFYGTVERVMQAMVKVPLPNAVVECSRCHLVESRPAHVATSLGCPRCSNGKSKIEPTMRRVE